MEKDDIDIYTSYLKDLKEQYGKSLSVFLNDFTEIKRFPRKLKKQLKKQNKYRIRKAIGNYKKDDIEVIFK